MFKRDLIRIPFQPIITKLMLQSMFAVTFTAYKDILNGIYSTLKYFSNMSDELNEVNFGEKFYAFLESCLRVCKRKDM